MRFIQSVDWQKIERAVKLILNGSMQRVDVAENIKVYECRNVIRIDLKIEEV